MFIKYVLGLTQTRFSPSVARVKMSSENGEKHIYAQEQQLCYYYIMILEGGYRIRDNK